MSDQENKNNSKNSDSEEASPAISNLTEWFELSNENFNILNAVSLASRIYFCANNATFYERFANNQGKKLCTLKELRK